MKKTTKLIAFIALILIFFAAMLVINIGVVSASAEAPQTYTTIYADTATTVNITTAGQSKYYRFVPTVSGTYEFYSDGSYDTYGYLLDASGNQLTSNDDGGNNTNFLISYNLVSGSTYYLQTNFLSSSETGSYTVYVSKIIEHENTEEPIETTSGAKTYTLFNSGLTGSQKRYSASKGVDANPNSRSLNNNYYDIYGQMDFKSTLRLHMGLSFEVTGVVTEQAILSVYAYDVDEEQGEFDTVYLVDETTSTETTCGKLSGTDDTWNTTVLKLTPDMFVSGHKYHFDVVISNTGEDYYVWLVYVRNVSLQLTIDGALPPQNPVITESDFCASINSNGVVSTTLSLTTSQDVTYELEYNATIDQDKRGHTASSVSVGTLGATKNVSFALESGSKKGTYQIDVIIKDATTHNVVQTLTVYAGYYFYSVSYNSNGGSQNLPTDYNAYSSGDTATALFNYIPSLYGYNFLGWSRDRYAAQPEFTANGNKTFTITSDTTLYAIWELEHQTHIPGEWIIDVQPTCTRSGSKHQVCAYCGETINTSYIPALGHNYGVTDSRAATCTQDGYITYTCLRCGDVYTITIHGEHRYELVETNLATCTENGYRRFVCSVCHDEYIIVIPAGQHDFVKQIVRNATHSRKGLVRFTCSKCNYSYDVETPMLKEGVNVLLVQDRNSWETITNMTVLNQLVNDEYIADWTMVRASDISSLDLYEYEMILIANDQYMSTYNALEAVNSQLISYVEAGGVLVYGACDNGWTNGDISYRLPGSVVKSNYYSMHNYILDTLHPVVTAAFTDGNGLTNEVLYHNYCSHSYFTNLPADANVILQDANGNATLAEYSLGNGHVILNGLTWEHAYYYLNYFYTYSFATRVYDDLLIYASTFSNGHTHSYDDGIIVEPACTQNGYTLHTCTVCGHTYRDNITPPLGHEWVTPEYYYNYYGIVRPAVLPGCDDPVIRYICLRCGEVIEDPAPGHDWNNGVVTLEPTCTTAGIRLYTCQRCLATKEGYIPLLGHIYDSVLTKELTCTEPGEITHTCRRCGDIYITYIYSEHYYQLVEHVEPTCTVDGYDLYRCIYCNNEYVETIPGGHNYVAVITRVASPTEDGIITYTCTRCGDQYIEIIPARPNATILLVQDRLPWTESVNTALLERLKQYGYITGWDITTTAELGSVNLALYNVIYIANDQTTATYNQLGTFNEMITQYAMAGGVVVYGACDHGWAAGDISYALPGGVTKSNYYSWRNYIANPTHCVVTGVLTDRKALTNELLYSTYSSHTYFNNLPVDAVVILEDANAKPTLVEYSLGNGLIIASGLTWEYTYVRNMVDGTSFAKSVYDDLLVYAVTRSSVCSHVWEEGDIIPPTCTEYGYTRRVCSECGEELKDNFVAPLGHDWSEWTIIVVPTHIAEGLERRECYRCGLVENRIISANNPKAIVSSDDNTVIVGQEIVFEITVSDSYPTNSMSIEPIFDDSIFEFVSAEWLINGFLQNIDSQRAVIAFINNTDVNRTVLRFTLRAIAPSSESLVSCDVKLQSGEIVLTPYGKMITVVNCLHKYKKYESIDDNYHGYFCMNCGYCLSVHTHVYDDGYDKFCNLCGYERPHLYGRWIEEVPPTCEDYGIIAHYYCSICHKFFDANYNEIIDILIPPLGHIYGSWITEIPATCTTDGAKGHYHCNVCGKNFNANFQEIIDIIIPALGHTPSDWIIDVYPTCTETGLRHIICLVCREILVEEWIPVTGHSYSDWIFEIPATCTDNGLRGHYHCYVCEKDFDENYNEIIDIVITALGHDWSDWCFDGENHWHECNRCHLIKDEHTHEYDNDYDNICNDCGYMRYVIGDYDNNGTVEAEDVIYFVYYLYFPETYPISQPVRDFDDNGVINSNDAVYLLYHVFYPNEYPLV